MFRNKVFLICLVVGVAALYRGYTSLKAKRLNPEAVTQSRQEAGQVGLQTNEEHSSFPSRASTPARDSRERAGLKNLAESMGASLLGQKAREPKVREMDEISNSPETEQEFVSDLEINLNERLQAVINSELEPQSFQAELEVCLSDPEIPASLQSVCKKFLNQLLKKYPDLSLRESNLDLEEENEELAE